MGIFAVMTANIPLATGTALAAQIKNSGAVTVCFFGDRATNEGVFHESMNIAALLKLPVLYVGINNAPKDAEIWFGEHTAAESMAALANVHGIPSEVIDGTDVLNVYRRALAIVEDLRSGQGPYFLECQCFPLDEPSRAQIEEWREAMKQTGQYEGMLRLKKSKVGKVEMRPPDHWLQGDPLLKLGEHLVNEKVASEGDLETIRADVRKVVEDAVAFAEKSPYPRAETALTGIFAGA
jgi:pyruvate dehydrogenase E1 component alpha subunit